MNKRPIAAVVVLGDIGRSPRMCYHAYSLATRLQYNVKIIGYLDTVPHTMINNNQHISYVPLPSPPDRFSRIPEFAQLPLKFIWSFIVLSWALLFRIGFGVKLVLLQNPPALPTMIVCLMVARLKNAKFVIDWHNYMWSVLRDKSGIDQLALPRLIEDGSDGKESLSKEIGIRKRTKEDREASIVISKKKRQVNYYDKKEKKTFKHRYIEWVYWCEGVFGCQADACLCVTRAMREDLLKAWGVQAAVFYDRAPSWTFGESTLNDRHELFLRLSTRRDGEVFQGNFTEDTTRFTSRNRETNTVILRDDRPMIVISSTSWTPDEDFQILIDAAKKYNDVAIISRSTHPATNLPTILLIITGRGPMKDYYIEKMNRLKLERVELLTPWLEPEDYPHMLAAADIGVSLHTSTSGLDLPMKVVDMFGSGLPVLAKKFNCIGELVIDGKNGKLFDSASELYQHLYAIATGFPLHSMELNKLKQRVIDEALPSWEDNWETVAKPILSPDVDCHFERIMARKPAENPITEH